MTDETGRFLEIGGARIEYRWYGPPPDRAPTLVFLHEGLGSVSAWRGHPARLADATGCGALVYSRRGYGRSSPLTDRRPIRFMHEEALEVLPQVLAATGVARPILVGHSDGGSIALVHAGSVGASSVRAVVLEAPHVFVEQETVQAIASIRQDYDRTDLKRKLARHHEDVDGAFLGWTTVWLDPDFLEWNIESYLPAVRCPVLAIQGDADAYGTVRQVEAVARGVTGRTEVVVLPGCGHSPHRERPRATLEAMARFIEEVLRQ